VEVIKGVFGLPDAPRAWWEEFPTTLKSRGMTSTVLDPAFFVLRGADRSIQMMIIVHVDDILVLHDSSQEAAQFLVRLRDKYPFGDWVVANECPEGVTYCGRSIQVRQVEGQYEAYVHQREFTRGRVEKCEVSPARKKDKEALATPLERSELRSVLGSLQWLVSMSRPDIAYAVNRLQRRQAHPQVKDLLNANKLVEEVKASEDAGIRIRPVKRPMVVAYGDSSLCNCLGDAIDDETFEAMEKAEKQKVRSQVGTLVTIIDADDEDTSGDVPCSIMDWKTSSSKRVVTSTFAAGTAACTVAVGCGLYVRVLLADVLKGPDEEEPEHDGSVVPLRIITDCMSLYDHVCKEGATPACRWTAIYVVALREAVAAGPGRDSNNAGLLWCPSREQQSDALAKEGLSDRTREFIRSSVLHLHEDSAQRRKRQARLIVESNVGQQQFG